ncbi:hypothetical protein RHMOL_Rhmol10G0302300 [Rhododendron molle]|uniref:Uncharacterized protein n=1 Tax=Rhododendron molle TaxID=49168 RepID=A0ACC0M8X4_RHOML|nr:hypothetical protein RHMOL_Rhmol10G0302300 [Rhododendron molle]
MGGGEGSHSREGDWECSGCGNRNYAFRTLCNRCKQPRLLVDTKTPKDSKWLPRIGDWICTDRIPSVAIRCCWHYCLHDSGLSVLELRSQFWYLLCTSLQVLSW